MKSIGKMMEDMGFNPQASASSKAAFVKYLAKQAYNVDIEIPEIFRAPNKPTPQFDLKPESEIIQLEFNLDAEESA